MSVTESPFKESLPASCPPAGAGAKDFKGVWRFVKSNPVTDQDFLSYHALGKTCPPDVNECRWASSSLFLNRDAAYAALPKMRKRFKYLAQVDITANCGMSLLTKRHIDFWRYATFTPNVVAVETI